MAAGRDSGWIMRGIIGRFGDPAEPEFGAGRANPGDDARRRSRPLSGGVRPVWHGALAQRPRCPPRSQKGWPATFRPSLSRGHPNDLTTGPGRQRNTFRSRRYRPCTLALAGGVGLRTIEKPDRTEKLPAIMPWPDFAPLMTYRHKLRRLCHRPSRKRRNYRQIRIAVFRTRRDNLTMQPGPIDPQILRPPPKSRLTVKPSYEAGDDAVAPG